MILNYLNNVSLPVRRFPLNQLSLTEGLSKGDCSFRYRQHSGRDFARVVSLLPQKISSVIIGTLTLYGCFIL